MDTTQKAKITITYPELVKEIEEIFNGRLKESETIEFKESISQMDNSIKTICAFLNNDGGSVYFGISDKGNPTGINLSDANIREISQKIMLKIKPEITPKISGHRINDIPVLKISVEKGINNIYYCNGVAYDRSGTSTIIMPPDEIRRRIIENNQIRWERQICKKADLTYLDIPTINKFLEMAKKAKRIPESKENIETILKKLELITDEGITNAAIVLFGKESSRYFPNTLLRCGRFKDELKKFFIDMKDYGVNIFENLEKGIDFIKEHMKIIARIVDLLRVEKWEIPIPALREAIINAMIHMDYTIGGFVYIAIYDNRIRISNPGYLMEGLTVDNLYNEHISIHRNELIAKIVYLSGLIDNWGRGTLNIIDYMSKDNLDFPKFEESACYFHIDFKRQFNPNEIDNAAKNVTTNVPRYAPKNVSNNAPKNVGRNERLEAILNKIKHNIRFTKRSLASELNIDEKTIFRDLEVLKKENKIVFEGSKKSGVWKMIK